MSNASNNKYRSLVSNTVIFGISTFGSKVLVFALTRLWTELLTPQEMGLSGFITATCNAILPVMYLCIAESVIRFGMDKEYRRGDILSVGVITVLCGWTLLWLFYPLLGKIENLAGHQWLILLYCLASAMRTVITNYVRATGLIRLFAIDGIVTTATTLAFNLVFLIGFDLGAVGFVLGTVVADGLSALSLFLLLRLHRFIRIRGIDRDLARSMFRYALPLIPTAMAWWITSLSDRYFVTYMVGLDASGIYDASQKIPNLIMMVSTFFTRAWELSAFSEYNSRESERFFSTVFRSYCSFIFLVASGLILIIKPFTGIYLSKGYYEAWRYSPYLILAVSFSCLVTFLGAVYNANKKNAMVTVTTVIGAAANLVLNMLLIPKHGPQGAAFATFISFLIVFLIRAVDTRRYIRIHMQPGRMLVNVLLLIGQVVAVLSESKHWILWECLCFGFLVLFNFGFILFFARRMLSMVRSRRKTG